MITTATLEVTSYAACFGGEHFRGTLRIEYDRRDSIYVDKTLTRTDASRLNAKDRDGGHAGAYKPGQTTERFETEEGLYRRAVETARKAWPDVALIVRGTSAMPREVLWAQDAAIEAVLTPLGARMEAIYGEVDDPWAQGYGKETNALQSQWDAIVGR